MNLESHATLHYVLEMGMYLLGLMANVLTAAHLSTTSKNNGVKSLKDYFLLRWIPISVRIVVCIFIFLLGWENPALHLEKLLDDSLTLHLGAAGFLGFASDEFTSKVLALVGMQKELPPVPQADV